MVTGSCILTDVLILHPNVTRFRGGLLGQAECCRYHCMLVRAADKTDVGRCTMCERMASLEWEASPKNSFRDAVVFSQLQQNHLALEK